MILTDEGALIILSLIVGFLLVLALIFFFGTFLAARGHRIIGLTLVGAVLAFIFGPYAYDRIANSLSARGFEDRTAMPEALDLTGLRVLFIEADSTICAERCESVLQLGIELEAYAVGMGSVIPDTFGENPLADIMDRPDLVRRVVLGPPNENILDQRVPVPVAGTYAPPYDVVIVADRDGLLSHVAPDLLGGPAPDRLTLQDALLIFTDWPDPYAAPPPAPTYRAVEGWMTQRRILFWPLSPDTIYVPSASHLQTLWTAAICPFAGDALARDVYAYGINCDLDSLTALFD